MGLLSFLTGRGRPTQAAADQTANTCRHPVLVPRWDRVQDMGIESKTSGYHCSTCGAPLTLEEASEARQKNAIVL